MSSFNIYDHVNQNTIDRFKPTYLYIKRHKVTGLLYFGKTTSKNVEKYNGSGTYWGRHLKVHGYNIETLWYCLFTDIQQLIETAIVLSNQMQIVEQKNFANLRTENGIDGGGNVGITFSRHIETWSAEQRQRHKFNSSKGGRTCVQNKTGMFDYSKIDASSRSKKAAKTALERGNLNLKNNHELYKEKRMRAYDQNGGSRGKRNSAFGTVLIHHDLIGNKRVHKELLVEYLEQGWLIGAEYSENHRNSRLGKKKGSYGESTKISCMICRKVLGITNFNQHMKKYHS